MRNLLLGFLMLASVASASAKDKVYQGTWVTTNRQLDGTMTCVVNDLGDNKWRGHFYGSWQGVDFSYKVDFRGPPDKLRGKANIDGADYEWTGAMGKTSPGWFKGKFDGSRYRGSFSLREKVK
jgi:hypothetical protein